jgi:hypothetical protein
MADTDLLTALTATAKGIRILRSPMADAFLRGGKRGPAYADAVRREAERSRKAMLTAIQQRVLRCPRPDKS